VVGQGGAPGTRFFIGIGGAYAKLVDPGSSTSATTASDVRAASLQGTVTVSTKAAVLDACTLDNTVATLTRRARSRAGGAAITGSVVDATGAQIVGVGAIAPACQATGPEGGTTSHFAFGEQGRPLASSERTGGRPDRHRRGGRSASRSTRRSPKGLMSTTPRRSRTVLVPRRCIPHRTRSEAP